MVHYSHELVFLRSENARQKLRELSGLLKKSPQRLKYSISQLERDKVINSLHVVFDYSYFGLILFRVYFKGGYISERDKGAIIERLSLNPYVVSIYELSGEFDFAIEIESKNPSRFNKELKNVADIIPTLNNYKVILNIVTHIYPRKYLVPELTEMYGMENEIIVGGDRETQHFEEREMTVMKNLFLTPNTRLSRLAKKSMLNIKTTKGIFLGLRNKRIIRGFKFLPELSKLEISKFRLFLKFHNMSKERDSQLLAYFKVRREIVQTSRTVGDWDMEVDIEAFDSAGIRQIIADMREEYKDIIQSFNLSELIRYYKKSYLPEYLFEDTQISTMPKQ